MDVRLLFTTFPWHSHHFPMVPLAWACQTAGHDVRVASSPSLTGTIIDSGLPAVPVGSDVDLPRLSTEGARASWHYQDRWPDDWPVHPERLTRDQIALVEQLGRMQCTMAAAMVSDLVSLAREWRPDLVVHDAVSFAGPVAAAALDVPSVGHAWGTPAYQRIEIQDLGRGEPLPEYLDLYEKFEVPARLEPTAWVDPCPDSMRYPSDADPRRLAMRYVPYNGPGTMPDWLLEPVAGQRICVTWGGTTGALSGAGLVEQVRRVVDAAAGLDAEVVLAVGEGLAAGLTDLPDRVRVAPGLPLHLLLPSCDAVVHHGGAGTTLTAAALGVPQLAVTRRPEPGLNGARLAATGAGRHLLAAELPDGQDAVEAVRAELARLRDPAYRRAAGRLRDEVLEMPTPSQVVSRLEELV